MNKRKTRKIIPEEFERLYYEENATIEEICDYFKVTTASIGNFRQRHGYKSRPKTARNKIYPDRWVCQQCGDSFPNKYGSPRKFCSHKCSSAFKKGKQPPGGFLTGDKHWNYTGKAIVRTYNHLVFNYADKKVIAENCEYTCRMCKSTFEILPMYKFQRFVSFDHIIPIALGGEHSTDNGQMLCRPCEKVKNSIDFKKIIKKNHK